MSVCILYDVAGGRTPCPTLFIRWSPLRELSRLVAVCPAFLLHEIMEGRTTTGFSIVLPNLAQGTVGTKFGLNHAFHSQTEFRPAQ
jgi:hypothetical protein